MARGTAAPRFAEPGGCRQKPCLAGAAGLPHALRFSAFAVHRAALLHGRGTRGRAVSRRALPVGQLLFARLARARGPAMQMRNP